MAYIDYPRLVRIGKGIVPDYGTRRNSDIQTWTVQPTNPYSKAENKLVILVRDSVNFEAYEVKKVYGTVENPGLHYEFVGHFWSFDVGCDLQHCLNWIKENL